MPQSPPKRVTRARAKKDVASKPGTTRITTASTKLSINKKSGATPAKTSGKAVDPVDEQMKDDWEEDGPTETPVAEPPKTRGRARATSKTTSDASVKPMTPAANAPAKSTRSRLNKPAAPVDKTEQLPKPRGRPKRNAEVEAPAASEKVAEGAVDNTAPPPPAKATRGRVAAVAPTKATTIRTRAAAAAPKKRVKFDDQLGQDKENQPVITDAEKKPETKATGLRAKPIRKPTSAKGGAKTSKATKEEVHVDDPSSKPDVLPLSPKKITQVAKTPSVGSEDELAVDKAPRRLLNKSPTDFPASVDHNAEVTVSRLGFASTDAPQSPTRETSPARLAISPRKPPPSPFKDALKESPRKIDLGARIAPPKFDAPSSPTKSPLKESPKRINLGDSNVKPILQWSKTPMKSSLMKSPARRPGGSSMKPTSKFSAAKVSAGVPTVDATTALTQVNTSKLPSLLSESAVSSPLRAANSPGHRFKVHDTRKEQSFGHEASTLTPSSAEESDIDGAFSEPEEPEETFASAVNVAPSPEHPRANAVIVDEPSFIILDRKSASAWEDDDSSVLENMEDGPHHIVNADNDDENVPTPMGPPTLAARPAFVLASPLITSRIDDSESEDELASPPKQASPSPLKNFGISAKDFGTPSVAAVLDLNQCSSEIRRRSVRGSKRNSVAMTPLAVQMSSWLASSPEKKAGSQAGYKRGIFSPARPVFPSRNQSSPASFSVGSLAKPSFFEDEMAVRDVDDGALDAEEGSTDELQDNPDDGFLEPQASQDSQDSEVFGDENAVPEDQMFFVEQQVQDHTLTCTPARVFAQCPREIHTVSKVPLRPAADDTPMVLPRKRSRSLAGPLSDISMPDIMSISRDSILSPILQDGNLSMSMLPGDPNTPATPETPTTGSAAAMTTPGRSIRKAGVSNVLKGAVVHVDVHTTEGADASGIFVDLLTQMGARCVKQWHWNPQAAEASLQPAVSPEADTPASKVGITHVVYKDGGKRTLEKVREAKGAVSCVGVGWVLDCEREDKWLDEANYAVDTSIIPRGGSRRRKSMEPRALANLNGNLVPAETPITTPTTQEMSPTKEFLNFDTPIHRRETFELQQQAPSTPIAEGGQTDDSAVGYEGSDSPLSPTTPYYLSKGATLVQQTCPPKQSQEMFFPLSGRIEDQPNEAVRQRLLMARRKSLQWASKVQSPLGRTVSYGK
ncbi:MAG: hypothetical protein Q9186_007224 [Xanthomendoza sp. 1 TL-2023]